MHMLLATFYTDADCSYNPTTPRVDICLQGNRGVWKSFSTDSCLDD